MKRNDRYILPIIGFVSVLVPILIGFLFFLPSAKDEGRIPFSFLPAFNACLNSGVTFLLILALFSIKNGKVKWHRTFVISAFFLSILFLISYIIYHSGPGHVTYNGKGLIRSIYFFILFSHILLSVAVVPLVLLTFYRGAQTDLGSRPVETLKHKKIARIAFPIWLYVAITGVIVYLMAHPFNPSLGEL